MDSSVLGSSTQSTNTNGGYVSLKLRQRVAELELALANQTSSSNNDVVVLEEQLTKLRASFERNELLRRKLEYELAVAHKELNHEVRNKIEEGEVKRKELDACKDVISIKTTALESINSLLHDQEILFQTQKESLLNEIYNHKTDNANLQSKIQKLEVEVEEISKRCDVITGELNNKCVESEHTDNMLKDQHMLFKKENGDLLNKIKEHKSVNANLRLENEKNLIIWKKNFDELDIKYKRLEDEHSKIVFELKSTEDLLHNQKMIYDNEKESFVKEIGQNKLYNENLKQEHDKIILNWKNKCEELNEKCSLLESHRIEHTTTIHKLVNDNKLICNNQREWIEKNKDLKARVKNLLENIEAERATHLETKFNTELMERKLQDLENVLCTERDYLKAYKNSIEEREKKCRHLDELNETLTKRNNELENKYEVQSKELTDKSVALSNIKLELDKLKEEIAEARSNLALHESSENDVMRELRFLLNNYEGKLDISGIPDEWTLHNIVEVINLILKDSRTQLNVAEENLQVVKSSLEKLTVEVDTQKQDAHISSKALEEADRLVKNAQHHGSAYEVKCSDYQRQIEMLKNKNDHLNSEVNIRNEKIDVLTNGVNQTKLEVEQCIQSTFASLQIIYDLLITGSVLPDYPSAYSMNELKDIIVDKLKQNIVNGRLREEEVQALHNELKQKADDILRQKQATKKLKKVDAELLSQSRKDLDDEKRVKQMLEEQLHDYKNAFSGMEVDRNNAMARCSDMEKLLKEMEQMNEKLKKSLHWLEQENKYIVVCMVVITGGLWALVLRHQSLCIEKSLLVNIIRQLFKLKGDVLELTETLHQDIVGNDTELKNNSRCVRGIFRFRITVIAVLGAIRFYKVALHTKTINSTQKSITCHNNLLFYGTPVENTQQKRAYPDGLQKERELSIWLNNNNVLRNACLDAVIPLVNLEKSKESVACNESFCHGNLVETICTCYARYLESVKLEMGRSSLFSVKFGGKKNSLMYRLGLGLRSLLEKKSYSHVFYKPVAKVASTLQKSIIELTSKHHFSEKEKQCLMVNCERYKEEKNKLKVQIGTHIAKLDETEKTLKAHIWDLERQIETTVSEEQFNDVCANLDDALQREDHLQILLKGQKNEIFQITSKIDRQEDSYQQSINLISANYKNHQEEFHWLQIKMEELKDKLLQLEQEKEEMNITLEKEHGEMEQFILERKVLVEYVKKVASVLKKNSSKVDIVHVNKLNKLHEILPEKVLGLHGKTLSPEMQVFQSNVISMVDLHKGVVCHMMNMLKEKQYLHGKITSLEDDAKAHRLNVQKLKNQISAICREDTDNNEAAKETSSPVFVPLNGHHNTHS